MTADKHDPSTNVVVALPEAVNEAIIIATDMGLGKWPTREERKALIEKYSAFMKDERWLAAAFNCSAGAQSI